MCIMYALVEGVEQICIDMMCNNTIKSKLWTEVQEHCVCSFIGAMTDLFEQYHYHFLMNDM
jgi:hypothetical protein